MELLVSLIKVICLYSLLFVGNILCIRGIVEAMLLVTFENKEESMITRITAILSLGILFLVIFFRNV